MTATPMIFHSLPPPLDDDDVPAADAAEGVPGGELADVGVCAAGWAEGADPLGDSSGGMVPMMEYAVPVVMLSASLCFPLLVVAEEVVELRDVAAEDSSVVRVAVSVPKW